jgi:hypothetical protein
MSAMRSLSQKRYDEFKSYMETEYLGGFDRFTEIYKKIISQWLSGDLDNERAVSLMTIFFNKCKKIQHTAMGYIFDESLQQALKSSHSLLQKIQFFEFLIKNSTRSQLYDEDKQEIINWLNQFCEQIQNRKALFLYFQHRGGVREFQLHYKRIAEFGNISAVKELIAHGIAYTEFHYRSFSGDPRGDQEGIKRVKLYLGLHELLESYKKNKSSELLKAIVSMFSQMDPQDKPDMLQLCDADKTLLAVKKTLHATIPEKKPFVAPNPKTLDAGDAKVTQQAPRSLSPQRLFSANEIGKSISDAEYITHLIRLLEEKDRPYQEAREHLLKHLKPKNVNSKLAGSQ